MANTQILLTALGIGVAQTALVNLKGLNQDTARKQSMLGTPVFSNMEIKDGSWIDSNGAINTYQGINIDTVLMTVSQSKNIVTTPVQGRDGTVKEYISDGDYSIEVQGVLVSPNGNTYPEEDVNKLTQILRAKEPIRIISEFLDYFGVSDVVVTDYSFPQVQGFRNQQTFTISMLSDTPIELSTNEL
jgi:hypothetical protein